MADESKKTRGAPKLPKSEITTVRLDPKLRYLAELAARKQRRSLSSFIEWAIEDALMRFPLKEESDWQRTVMGEAERLWDVDAADRFVKLALNYPELLTHDEQVLWKLVRENGAVWRGYFAKYGDDWTWEVDEKTIMYTRLREHWDAFKDVASGELPPSFLPSWTKKKGQVAPAPVAGRGTSGFEDMDDDIKF